MFLPSGDCLGNNIGQTFASAPPGAPALRGTPLRQTRSRISPRRSKDAADDCTFPDISNREQFSFLATSLSPSNSQAGAGPSTSAHPHDRPCANKAQSPRLYGTRLASNARRRHYSNQDTKQGFSIVRLFDLMSLYSIIAVPLQGIATFKLLSSFGGTFGNGFALLQITPNGSSISSSPTG